MATQLKPRDEATPFAGRDGNDNHYTHSFTAPDQFPEYYAARGVGTCLEPEVPDGSLLAFTTKGKPARGDLIGIWLRPECVPVGQHQQMLKRLVMDFPGMSYPFTPHPDSNGDPTIIVEMLNPPRQLAIRCRHILAIHKCIGPANIDEQGRASIQKEQMQ